jgi:guanosine-3',5'-bis(diphosphate) 3'-pyrophosphohydrolase
MTMTIPRLLEAVDFASTAHHGQLRGGDRTPYVNHVLDVAKRVAAVGFEDLDTLIAALLHDTVEDTPITTKVIQVMFGDRVASLVEDLTLPPEARKDREAKQVFQLGKMRVMDAHGQAIKVADKTSNVHDLVVDPPKWGLRAIRGYSDAAREVVLAANLDLDPRLKTLVETFERSIRRLLFTTGGLFNDYQNYQYFVQNRTWTSYLRVRGQSHR